MTAPPVADSAGTPTREHQAMATTFAFWIPLPDSRLARQAAEAACREIDRLESLLSRYAEGSDIFRINRLQTGQTLRLADESYRCLLLAWELHTVTGGLFDVSLGRQYEHRKHPAPGAPFPPVHGRLLLHPDEPAVTCEAPGREIDLGAIGKGFALDEIARLFRCDWELPAFLLSAGGSSLLAGGLDPQPWPLRLRGNSQSLDFTLLTAALSGSGSSVQGAHIWHPVRGDGPYPWIRTWALAPDAATSDALSTAALLAGPEIISPFASALPPGCRLWIEEAAGGRILPIGASLPAASG